MPFLAPKGLNLKPKPFTTGNDLADAILGLAHSVLGEGPSFVEKLRLEAKQSEGLSLDEQIKQALNPKPGSLAYDTALGFSPALVVKKFLPGPKTLDQLLFRLGKAGEALNPRTLIAALRNPTTKEIATGGIGIQAHPYGKVPKGFMERGFLPPDLPATSENFIPDHALDILSQPALVKQAFEQGTLDELITNAFKRMGSKGRF